MNQYTDILTPGLKDIIGAALATNSVSVNGGLADRKGEYFHRQIIVANTNQPVWQMVTNISGTFTNKGGLVFPANNQTLAYDADGNLTFDGIWTYQWDGENRLISMTMTNISGIVNANRLKLDFAYDFMGRRISKIISIWNPSTLNFQPSTTNLFVYDGWNLLATFNPQLSTLNSFAWGNDLSGTMTGAGGVGGLLMANLSGTNCFIGYDGNGNITALINVADKSLAARYEYSPYGELIRATGLLARQMPFGFSTKFRDGESGLVYYNYRYYSPILGRWLSKDPLEEQAGLNLLAFIRNNSINHLDTDGREDLASESFADSLGAGLDRAMGGAILNAAISGVTSEFENAVLGAHNNVMSDILSGMFVGAVLGPGATGTKLIEGVATKALGENYGGYAAAGITAVLSTFSQAGVKAQWGDDEQMQRLAKDPLAQAGVAIGIGLGAKFIGNMTGIDPDSIILNATLNIAGDQNLGVDAEENIWGEAEEMQ